MVRTRAQTLVLLDFWRKIADIPVPFEFTPGFGGIGPEADHNFGPKSASRRKFYFG